MSTELINKAIEKGAKLYGSVSGGKDGQAMVKTLYTSGYTCAGLIHADLGRVEWPQSHSMCETLASEFNVPLHIVRRSDGRDLIAHWNARLEKLAGTGKPFWSSASERYCTSDMKRDPINKFLTNCGHDFIVSCEGIRAQESTARAKKTPLQINSRISSKHYKGMTVEKAIENYQPGKRLVLTWYPIFNFTVDEVWETYGMSAERLALARRSYRMNKEVPAWWPFHPAYALGNNRVSCVFCILGCQSDLQVGAEHRPELLDIMIEMETRGGATFKNGWSLANLKINTK